MDGYDPERGVKVVGHRGYCLTGYGLFLNLALINYGLEFLFLKGYKPNQPPHFMLKDMMAKTAQLEQFDEELYKVTEGEDKSTDSISLLPPNSRCLLCMIASGYRRRTCRSSEISRTHPWES